ncbi:MAG: thiol peroxidase [Bacteroidales bacterium]|nr:thiol peroxidase [Bacteroidales bacterium]
MEKNNIQVTFKGNPINLLGKATQVGQKAEDFTVVGNGLNPVKLSDYSGKVVILSVFPSLDTPVCATQNRKFNEAAAGLSDEIVILGLSVDLPFAQARFCGAEGIDKVVTASDYQMHDFSAKYGFLIDGLRLLTRGTVVIDKTGVVKFVEYVPEATDEPNYEAALKAAKELV